MQSDIVNDCRGVPITVGGYVAFAVMCSSNAALRHGRVRAVKFDGKYSARAKPMPPLIQIEREVAPGIMARWGTRDVTKLIVAESSPAA